MARSKNCPKCQGSMTEGFLLDRTQGGRGLTSWVEGTPQKSIWVGVKLGGKKPMEVATWRCGSCGYLESYARPQ